MVMHWLFIIIMALLFIVTPIVDYLIEEKWKSE